jgi:hypothetical protein
MPRYRYRNDGLYDVETSAGFMPMSTNDYMLRELGYEPEETPVPPPVGRTAQANFDDYDRIGRDRQRSDAGGGGSGGSGGSNGTTNQEGAGGTRDVAPSRRAAPRERPSHSEGYVTRDKKRDAEWHESVRREVEEYEKSVPGQLGRIWNDPNASYEEKQRASERLVPGASPEKVLEMATTPEQSLRPREEVIDFDADEYEAEQVAAGSVGPQSTSTYAPPADMKSSWTVKKAKGIDPELLEQEDESALDQKLAIVQQGEIEARSAGLMGDAADHALEQTERNIKQDEIKFGRIKRDFERRQAQIQDERAQIDEMKVDPDRIFSGDGGTWARILAGISILAGGILMGLQGRQSNPGLDAIHQAIDRDIRNQKEKIAARREGVAGQETELERLMTIYGNPEMAERELRNRQLAIVSAYAKRATMNSPDDVRANVDAQLADFDARRVRDQMQLDQMLRDDVVEQWRHFPGGVVGGGVKDSETQGLAAAYQKEGIPQAEADLGESEDILKEIPKSGEIPTPESRNLASRAVRGVADFFGGQGAGSRMLDTPYEQTIRGKFLRAKAKARHAIAGASLTEGERADFEKQFEGVNTIEGLRALNDSVRRAIDRRKAAVGAGYKPEVSREYEQRKRQMTPRSGPKSTRSDE